MCEDHAPCVAFDNFIHHSPGQIVVVFQCQNYKVPVRVDNSVPLVIDNEIEA